MVLNYVYCDIIGFFEGSDENTSDWEEFYAIKGSGESAASTNEKITPQIDLDW